MISQNRKILYFLNGEFPELAKAEVMAACEAEDSFVSELEYSGQVLVLENRDLDAKRLADRLGMTHSINELLAECSGDLDGIREAARKTDFSSVEGTFAVRCRAISKSSKLSESEVERLVGSEIENAADLGDPDTTINVFLQDGRCHIARKLAEIDTKAMSEREPMSKPFFNPGSVTVRAAKLHVNLSRARKGEEILDPFAGTGGMLIEAGLIGCELNGIELDERMSIGCLKNLDYYGLDCNLIRGDARDAPKYFDMKFRSIIADPPYGIATKADKDLGKLYLDSLESLKALLADDGHLVIGYPTKIDITKGIESLGYTIKERYEHRIHKSLTRNILVLQK